MTLDQLKQVCLARLARQSASQLQTHQKSHIERQVEILGHYSNKDNIYTVVPLLSTRSVHFIRKAYRLIEDNDTFRI